jgi:hypothetical protein
MKNGVSSPREICWGSNHLLKKKKTESKKKNILRIFTNFYGATPKSVSGQQLPQILPPSN